MAETIQYTIQGSKYGLNGNFDIPVLPEINGQGVDAFPRNQMEQDMLDHIITKMGEQQNEVHNNLSANGGIAAEQTKNEAAVKAYEQSRIEDPMRADLKLARDEAEQSPLGMRTFFDQLTNIGPGGDQFRPDILGQSIKDNFMRKTPKDPKRMMGDMSVIATDIFLAAMSMGNIKANAARFNIPLFTNEVRRLGIKGVMEKAPARTTVLANMLARSASDTVYDNVNEIYRYLEGIPEDTTDDPIVENVLNLRDEFLWSGGAVGIAKLFPYIKPFIGKTMLGIDDNAKRLASLGRKNGVPMSVFNVTKSGLIQSMPPVVGLFPIVAGKARMTQNAQMSSAYNTIINSIEELSPVTLLADAGLLIDKGFRNTVKDFATMKGTLFANARTYARSLDKEQFIPTSRLKELGASMRQIIGEGQFKVNADSAGQRMEIPFDDLMAGISGKGDEVIKTLAQFDGLPNHLNANQYMALVQKLNKVKRNLPELKLDSASDEALLLNDMHTAAIRALNDPNKWKEISSPEQRVVAEQFSASYAIANDFFFKNADTIKGRSSMLLKQTDPNIGIAGAPPAPGYLFADQMAKIFLNDDSILSPMALKEMRKAVGDDAFFAASRTFFDDIFQKNTEFVSGKIRVPTEAASIWQRTKAKITGKPINKKYQTIEYNIPVMDIDTIAKGFGLNDINRRAGIKEIFEAKGRNGQDMLDQLDEVMELAKKIYTPNYGDVSSFVKRRGFLGGLGSIANLFTGGAILADPISSAGIMLMGRFGMSALSDPKFLDGMVRVLDPNLGDVARKSALVTMGRGVFDPERAVNEGYDINEIGDIIELIALGRMDQGVNFNERAQNVQTEQDRVPEAIRGERDLASVQENTDPFLELPEGYMDEQVNVQEQLERQPIPDRGRGQPLNAGQRVALATGNLDEAIALRGNTGSNNGLGSLRGSV